MKISSLINFILLFGHLNTCHRHTCPWTDWTSRSWLKSPYSCLQCSYCTNGAVLTLSSYFRSLPTLYIEQWQWNLCIAWRWRVKVLGLGRQMKTLHIATSSFIRILPLTQQQPQEVGLVAVMLWHWTIYLKYIIHHWPCQILYISEIIPDISLVYTDGILACWC